MSEQPTPLTLQEVADHIESNNDHILKDASGGYSAGFHYALECLRYMTEGCADE